MFLVRRIALAMVAIAALSIVVFALFGAAPGRAGDEAALEGRLTASERAASELRARQRWHERYVAWSTAALRGDLGISGSYGRPVAGLVVERMANTLVLIVPSLVLAWCAAVPLGLWAAAGRSLRVDRLTLATTSALGTVPDVIAAAVVAWGATRLGAFTTLGTLSDPVAAPWAHPALVWPALRLPLGLIVLTQLPGIVRNVRVTALTVAEQPFLRAARARGVSTGRLMWRHVGRAILPVLAALAGGSLASGLGGALVAEVVFSWPGVGALLYHGAQARDEALVAGAVLAVAVAITTTNLVADGAGWLLDPRRNGRT